LASRAGFGDLSVAGFVERLASTEPVPGGGSAAAVAASLAAGLVTMVATLSEGRPAYAAHAELHARAAADGRLLARRLLDLADEDADAYARFAAAIRLPRDTERERDARAAAMRGAARIAAEVPLRTVEACVELIALAEALAGRSNRNAASDLEVASRLTAAAAESAAANVRVNLPAIEDDQAAGELTSRVDELMRDIGRLADGVRAVVAAGERRAPLEGTDAGDGLRP
jgi:formiminotetrahydrofolate cyclodeaminase